MKKEMELQKETKCSVNFIPTRDSRERDGIAKRNKVQCEFYTNMKWHFFNEMFDKINIICKYILINQ